ncbi:MAG: sigma 54-interacting transcriptional regulator [Thermoanaerobaculia bacterium]
MPMRRSSGSRKAETISLGIRDFGWDAPRIAALDHSTLPWHEEFGESVELAATPLTRCGAISPRDALSLLGQFAAHASLLRAVGSVDVVFDADAWSIVRSRGADARLVRTSAHGELADDPAAALEAFADAVRVRGLETLSRSWTKPESVYIEIARRLRSDVTADVRWFKRAAAGLVRAPGLDALRDIGAGRRSFSVIEDPVPALSRFATLTHRRLVVFGGAEASPLRRGSALAAIANELGAPESWSEGEAAETIERMLGDHETIVVVSKPDQFDAFSRNVVAILATVSCPAACFLDPAASFVQQDDVVPAAADRWFLISQRVVARRDLELALEGLSRKERSAWVSGFIGTPAWEKFLEEGALPATAGVPDLAGLREPKRSYLAAVAMAGESVDARVAAEILTRLECHLPLDEVGEAPFATSDGRRIRFAHSVRRHLIDSLPHPTRHAIALVAAPVLENAGDALQAARILIDAGADRDAVIVLEQRVDWTVASADVLEAIPADIVRSSPALARRLADRFVSEGRLADAADLADHCSADDAKLIRARVERRRGNYSAALAQLRGIEPASAHALLLEGEIRRLETDYDDARAALEKALSFASGDELRARIEYELALVDLDGDGRVRAAIPGIAAAHYLARRYAAYAALSNGAHDEAIKASTTAVAVARDVEEKIDAMLDLIYATFLAGRWTEARHHGLAALALVEETQGDRAAGGILFTLGYLAADSGQWARANDVIARLRRFYHHAGDARRAREVDLIAAHVALGRGAFRDAQRIASSLLNEKLIPSVREGAALIADECDLMEGRLTILRSSSISACLELADRHRFLHAVLTGRGADSIRDPFGRALALWVIERMGGRGPEPPEPGSHHERLRLMRALFAVGRARHDQRLLHDAVAIARSTGTDLPIADEQPAESRDAILLRKLATADYPFEPDALGEVAWRFATRNRLGQWSETGSSTPLGDETCESLLHDPTPDVELCGATAFVKIAGLDAWPAESRAAVAALFRIRQEHHNLRRVVEQEAQSVRETAAPRAEGIVGESPAIRALHERIASAARSEVAACILGESGSGKELIARAIHRGSSRRSKPFTPVNCAALPETLIESELFGHARGAFTGADRDRAGVIEITDGGTLFLDEIGELPLQAQAKLLRFLQEGEFRRVGEATNRTADVRVVAATNRKLEQAVDDGRFREDLFYRIVGIEIPVPPLRERGSDILLLANFFLEEERKRARSAPMRFSPDVEAVFLSHRWPGNVRELQNAVRAGCAIAGDAREIDLEHLPDRLRNVLIVRTPHGTYYEEVVRFRKSLIEKSLVEAKGNQNRAAKALGMSRQALGYQIRELGIMVKG